MLEYKIDISSIRSLLDNHFIQSTKIQHSYIHFTSIYKNNSNYDWKRQNILIITRKPACKHTYKIKCFKYTTPSTLKE